MGIWTRTSDWRQGWRCLGYLRLRRVTPRRFLLVSTKGIGVGRAVVVAGHDGFLVIAHAGPVVGGAVVDLGRGASEA